MPLKRYTKILFPVVGKSKIFYIIIVYGESSLCRTESFCWHFLALPSVLSKVEGVASGIAPARLGTAQQAADRQVLDGVVAEAPPRDTAIGTGHGLVAGCCIGWHLAGSIFISVPVARQIVSPCSSIFRDSGAVQLIVG